MPVGEIKAIETRYKGYRFRSRLEARWAVYFDAIGCPWEYEPQGYHLGGGISYLPDFRLLWPGQLPLWAKVKPAPFSTDELERTWRLAAHTGEGVLHLVGPPAFASYWAYDRRILEFGHGDPSGVSLQDRPCVDYVLVDFKGQRRFYVSTGADPDASPRMEPVENDEFLDELTGPVHAARAARFEHGESPNRGGGDVPW